jgi:hypothetical protein
LLQCRIVPLFQSCLSLKIQPRNCQFFRAIIVIKLPSTRLLTAVSVTRAKITYNVRLKMDHIKFLLCFLPLSNPSFLNRSLLLAETAKDKADKLDTRTGSFLALYTFPRSYGQKQFRVHNIF